MADGKMQVGKVEHYAVYLALVISMVTTFLLGMLLTETLFGTGLNYFGNLSEENRLHSASARELQTTGPVVNLNNNMYRTWSTGGSTYYQFRVNVRNAGTENIRKLVISYAYDRSIFEYVTPGQSISRSDGTPWFSMLLPQTAHAQVSIDFPLPSETPIYACTLDTQVDPALCDVTSDGTIFKKGTTRTADFVFKLRAPYVQAQPSLLERLFGWFVGHKASAQVSIDFPTGFNTQTTATVVQAMTVSGKTNVTGDLTATASAWINL